MDISLENALSKNGSASVTKNAAIKNDQISSAQINRKMSATETTCAKTLAPFLTTVLLSQEVRGEINAEDVLKHLSSFLIASSILATASSVCTTVFQLVGKSPPFKGPARCCKVWQGAQAHAERAGKGANLESVGRV